MSDRDPRPAVPIDAYKVLQVDPEADQDVIQAAYRRLARKWHPDVASGSEAAARMVTLNLAWGLVGDPQRRAAYDRERTTDPPPTRAADPAKATARTHAPEHPPEEVSRDWTSGRSSLGGRYDASMRTADGTGAAGAPPGDPAGSVLNFGRYTGWSLGEIARADLEYIEWLDRMPIGRPYRDEIDTILRRSGRRRSAAAEARSRPGLFRRR